MLRSPLMDEALELARQGLGRTSPNPVVGAVLVKDGQIVGRGFHTYGQAKHAEVIALEEAGAQSRGATLYITLEPCSHHGRTPPCADALVHAGGIAVEIASEYTDEAERLNEPFIHSMKTGLPLVTLKAALTLDGKIAAPEDNTGWITSERARAHVQEIRHVADAILTGIGTVLSDDCLLSDRTGLERSRPLLRIVADSTLRIPVNSRMIASANGDVAVITTSASSEERRRALEYRGVRVVVFDGPGGRVDLSKLPAWLASEQYRSLMIESGSKLNWAALESGIVDKIFFYYAPKILGGLRSLPVAGGTGRLRRTDAIQLHQVRLHSIPPDEFAVEGYVLK